MFAGHYAPRLGSCSPLRLSAGSVLLTRWSPSANWNGPMFLGRKLFFKARQLTGSRMIYQPGRVSCDLGLSLGGCRGMVTSNSPDRLVWITKLKTGSDTAVYKDTRPLGASRHAQHILLAGSDYREPQTDVERERAAEVVQQDGKENSPIDCVVSCVDPQYQTGNICTALDGLKPRGLVVECGPHESHCLDDLQKLKTPWPLEYLWISSNIDPLPPVYENVTSLGLYYCCGVQFAASHPFKALTELMVYENDACDTFTRIVLNNHLTDPRSLKTLRLSSSNGYDWSTMYWPCDTLRALKLCPAIETFELNAVKMLDGVDDDGQEHILATSLPQTLQHLRLRLPPTMVEEMPSWIELASDPRWLPDLKTITFRLDSDLLVGQVPEFPIPVPTVEEFLAALKQSHTSVQVDQSWNDVSPAM